MDDWKVPLYKILVDKEDVNSVSKVIKRGNYWALGPEIEDFEKDLANYIGTRYCVTFNSGTSALHASLLSLNLGIKNEILVPSFTFISTANSVLMSNLVPKFVDIESSTFGLDPNLIEKSISKNTKAIIPVHYAGSPCDISSIKQISNSKKLFLIEDAAESLGSSFKGKKIGSFGDLGIFSFAGNKVLTTGEGGAIVTNSKKLFERLKLIRSHGRDDKQNYFASIDKPKYIDLGYNWRMSSITAALGISQLNKIEKLISMRRKNANYLTKKLQKIEFLETPFDPPHSKHVYQLYTIKLRSSFIRNKLKKFLQTKKIMSKVFFYPIHKTNYYKNILTKSPYLPVTESLSDCVLTLPMYPELEKTDLDYVSDSIVEFFESS